MAFTGDESDPISLATGSQWTANYRNASPNSTNAHFFGYKKLNSILKQDGCIGIRAYYALDDQGQKQLILVGVDANEKDLSAGIILDRSFPCPPYCGGGGGLGG
ncbi:MAG: hypothetical protein JST26_12530 [Bacteroidetes bacterium]|nr:hypothetical protein [Bacteroidota bacterium]